MIVSNAMTNATSTICSLPVPVAAAMLSAIVSAIVAFFVSMKTLRAQRLQHIENMITKLVDVGITYPNLENDAFCANWNVADKTDKEVMRYDNYCCLVFNLLETMWKYYRGNTGQIEDFFNAREEIIRHNQWWKSQHENTKGYRDAFRAYVNSVIAGESL